MGRPDADVIIRKICIGCGKPFTLEYTVEEFREIEGKIWPEKCYDCETK